MENTLESIIQATPKVEKKAGIVLFKESGDVFYKRPGDSDYIQLSATSMEIPNLTSVKTAVGRGSVLLPSNSVISLSENTELSVNFTDNSTSIFQSAGNTYHRVQALLTGKTYEVQTPGTLAAVRGTKFAVAYDKAKSTTKVAVTEHSVSVARIKKSFEPNATTTETKLEEVQVTEGSSAKITESTTTPATSGGKPTPIDKTPKLVVSKIDDDTELKSWVDENKARDPILDKLKSDIPDLKVYREQLENTLKSPIPQTKPITDITKPVTDTTKPVAQDTTKPVTDTTKPATVTPTKPVVEATPIVVKKISEEEFFDKFNAVFVKNFYVENDDSICSLTATSDARVKETSDLAISSGYPLPDGSAASLKKFSEDIIYYCKNGKGDTKARSALQVRFDEEFPFKNSL
jgi:hypothetical protein